MLCYYVIVNKYYERQTDKRIYKVCFFRGIITMLLPLPKNQCKHISFPFLSEAHKITTFCLKKEYISLSNTHVTRKIHHHSFFEIHFILKGHVEYEIENEVLCLEGGQMLLVLPKTNHRLRDASENVIKYSIALSFGSAYNKTIVNDIIKDKYCKADATDDVFATLQYIADAHYDKDANGYLTVSARAFSLICSLPFKFYNSNFLDSGDDVSDARLADAKQYIKDNIGFNISCTQVAQHCYLSVKQLSRIFVKYEGTTLMKYITKAKTEAAEQLLANSDISLKEISLKLGFCNEYYFNSFFKKNSGMSPGDYRKTIK